MIKNLLAVAALTAAVGCAVSAANATPATSMLETLKAGADEFVKKPFNIEKLIERVGELLGV